MSAQEEVLGCSIGTVQVYPLLPPYTSQSSSGSTPPTRRLTGRQVLTFEPFSSSSSSRSASRRAAARPAPSPSTSYQRPPVGNAPASGLGRRVGTVGVVGARGTSRTKERGTSEPPRSGETRRITIIIKSIRPRSTKKMDSRAGKQLWNYGTLYSVFLSTCSHLLA